MKKSNPTKGTGNERNVCLVEFDSIREFYDYITKTPTNHVFDGYKLDSFQGSSYFCGTDSFEQATDWLLNGWDAGIEKLMGSVKKIESSATVTKPRPIRSMAGYQAVVPAYLNNDPRAMISSVRKPVKQPVVNVTKMIGYSGGTSANTVFNESVKALMIIRQLEASGQRVNLYVVRAHSAGGKTILCRVRIKGSNERLNIAKLAFPLCSPSMQRRMMFRFTEVFDGTTKAFRYGYGCPLSKGEAVDVLPKDEIVLPTFIKKSKDEIANGLTFEQIRNL